MVTGHLRLLSAEFRIGGEDYANGEYVEDYNGWPTPATELVTLVEQVHCSWQPVAACVYRWSGLDCNCSPIVAPFSA